MMKKIVSTAVSARRTPVLSPNRFSRKSGRVSDSVAMVYLRNRAASTVHVNQAPSTSDTIVHRCTAPSEKASAGNTSIVQPLVAEEPALSAEVKLLIRRPART